LSSATGAAPPRVIVGSGCGRSPKPGCEISGKKQENLSAASSKWIAVDQNPKNKADRVPLL